MNSMESAGGTNSHPLLSGALQDEYRRLGYWEEMTLAMVVESWAERDPQRIAVTGETQLTYGELWEQARRVAGSLREGGLQDGEVILAVMANCWQGVVLEVAASVVGACYCPRSAKISPTSAWNLFEQLDVRGVVLSAELLASGEWRAMLSKMASHLTDRPIMLQGDAASLDFPYPRLESAALTGTVTTRVDFARCRPCLVLSTGGSTGQPKSILHCSESLVYAVRRFGEDSGYSERDVHVSFLPYGHAAGSLFEIYMPLLFGASILPINRWHAQTVAELIEKFGGTYFITMGTHIFDLLAMDPAYRRCLSSLRLLITGAGPDMLFLDGERELGVKMVRDYGFSECPGHALGRPGDPPEARLCQDGVPFTGMTTRILDTVAGGEAALGKAGEYQCLGPNLFMGYAGVAELTANAMTEDGFYKSGDLMARTADGYITWKGRTRDIIRRGGLQIDAIELEGMLDRHPKISTVVVVAEPHPRLGERAVIVAVAQSDVDAPVLEELCEYLLKQGVEKQSLPERLVLVDEIPKTELGKFHRIEMQRRLAEQRANAG